MAAALQVGRRISIPTPRTPDSPVSRVERAKLLGAAALALIGYVIGRALFERGAHLLTGYHMRSGMAEVLGAPAYVAVVWLVAILALRLAGDVGYMAKMVPLHPIKVSQIAIGFVIGAGLVPAALALSLTSGWGHATAVRVAAGMISGVLAGLLVFAVIAWNEELVFRGLLLPLLGRLGSQSLAGVLASAAFAAVHLGAPRVTPEWLVGLFVLGLASSMAFAATRTLWRSIGLHWGLNFCSFLAFNHHGLPFRFVLTAPQWLVGVPNRLSSGLIMIVLLAGLTVIFAFQAAFHQQPARSQSSGARGRSKRRELA